MSAAPDADADVCGWLYGVVAEPGLDGTADEIEQMAHAFLGGTVRRGDTGLRAGMIPVESFIAPVDFELAGVGTIAKGSWVLCASIEDDQLWQELVTGDHLDPFGVVMKSAPPADQSPAAGGGDELLRALIALASRPVQVVFGDGAIQVDATSRQEHNLTVEAPKRGAVRVEVSADGSRRYVPEDIEP